MTSLRSRYGVLWPVELRKTGATVDFSEALCLSVGGDKDDVQFIDPDGGPFLSVGHIFPNTDRIISEIKRVNGKWEIEFES